MVRPSTLAPFKSQDPSPAIGLARVKAASVSGCLAATPRTACGSVHRLGVSACVVAAQWWRFVGGPSQWSPSPAPCAQPALRADRREAALLGTPVGCAAGRPLKLHVRPHDNPRSLARDGWNWNAVRLSAPSSFAEITPKVISYPGDAELSYSELADLVTKQLPSPPFVLLGESFSGPVALAVAQRVAPVAIVLVCSFVTSPRPSLNALRFLVRWLPSPAKVAGPLALALMGKYQTPALRSALLRSLESVAPAVLRHRAASALSADAKSHLASLHCRSCTCKPQVTESCLARVLSRCSASKQRRESCESRAALLASMPACGSCNGNREFHSKASECGLTHRSSGAPSAGRQARPGGTRYIVASPALAPCRRCPLSSNVRPQFYGPTRSHAQPDATRFIVARTLTRIT